MNFENDELNLRKELWTLKCKKLIGDYDTRMRYDTDEEKKKNKDHRLLSDYVNVLFDEGVEFGLINSSLRKKRRDKKGKEVSADKAEKQKLFESLTEIQIDVENVHKIIRNCASPDEIEAVSKQEDVQVFDYHLRVQHWLNEIMNDKNKEKYEKMLGDEKRLAPIQ